MLQQAFHLGEAEVGADRFERAGRHAGGHRDPHVERQGVSGVQEPAHAGLAGHVGYLVRVADGAGNATPEHAARVLGGADEGRFNVHVPVDQAGHYVSAVEV